ncbi:MAG: tetratricopeptide repeat protein [Calditrichaceae bacterium]
MKGIGYQEKIKIGSREFQIHTGNNPNKNVISTEVFESGKFIFTAFEYYDVRIAESDISEDEYLKSVTYETHQTMIEDIRLLFIINEKLKGIKQYLPHYRLGKIFYAKGFYEEAIENFNEAIAQKPDFIRGMKRLGLAYLGAGHPNDAVEIFQKAHELKNKYPDILNCLGVALTQVGQYENATKYLQKAIDIKNDYMEANFNLGIVLFLSTVRDSSEKGNVVIPARVLRFFKAMKDHQRYQSDLWKMKFEQALESIQSGRKNKIIQALAKIQLDIATIEESSEMMDFFLLKFMYGGKELTNDELEYFEKLVRDEVEAHPMYADYWNELGVIHLIQCRDYFLKSINEFENAIKINPQLEIAKENHDLLKKNKNGFLILLRAILR